MKFFSTRDPKITRTPSEAIAEGIAPDGGLYLPESFPAFPMERLSSMSGDDISVAVLSRLFDDFSEDELRASVMAAYDESFDNGVFDLDREDDFFTAPADDGFDEFDAFDNFENYNQRGQYHK